MVFIAGLNLISMGELKTFLQTELIKNCTPKFYAKTVLDLNTIFYQNWSAAVKIISISEIEILLSTLARISVGFDFHGPPNSNFQIEWG